MVDFNPLTPSDDDDKLDNVEEIENKASGTLVPIDINKDPLSIVNLTHNAVLHIQGDERARQNMEKVAKEMNDVVDKMSCKELIDYYKVLLQERIFHTDFMFKALNFIVKTPYAKPLLTGSEEDKQNLSNITNKSEITALANLFKKYDI